MTHEHQTNPETPCVGCGYDLRGLDPQGRCPECSTAIARSLAGERLANADPAWLGRIVRGQRLAFFGLRLTVFGVVASLLFIFVGGMIATRLGFDLNGPAGGAGLMVILIMGVLGGMVIACIGFFLVTSLDPRETDRELPTSQRLLARWGMVVAIILLVLGELDALEGSPGLIMVGTAISLMGLAALAVAIPAMFLWLAGLAERIPTPKLATRTSTLARTVQRRLWILIAIAVVERFITLVPAGTPLRDVADIIDALAGCGVIIVVLLLLFNLLMLFGTMPKLTRAFKELAAEVS